MNKHKEHHTFCVFGISFYPHDNNNIVDNDDDSINEESRKKIKWLGPKELSIRMGFWKHKCHPFYHTVIPIPKSLQNVPRTFLKQPFGTFLWPNGCYFQLGPLKKKISLTPLPTVGAKFGIED